MSATIYRVGKDRVPGVTTVIGRFKESGGLIHWAWQLGADGKDYRDARNEAAEAGHIVHSMVERHIKGLDPTEVIGPEEQMPKARQGFEAFCGWADQTKMRVIESERALISEKRRFGGTLDAIGIVGGKRALIDWKTSNRIYADYLIQVSAYRMLWDENYPDAPIETIHLVRFGKEHADFTHHSWPIGVCELGSRAFLHMLELYDLDKQLKKAVGA